MATGDNPSGSEPIRKTVSVGKNTPATVSVDRTLFLYNNLIDTHNIDELTINGLIDRFADNYEEQLIRLVSQTIDPRFMQNVVAKRVRESIDIQKALADKSYNRVVYFGHVLFGRLSPDMAKNSLEPEAFAIAAPKNIIDIVLIGCVSKNFATPLKKEMTALGNPAAHYWGTDKLTRQGIVQLTWTEMFKKGSKVTKGETTSTGIQITGLWLAEEVVNSRSKKREKRLPFKLIEIK
jgi:hypothetical protein